MYKYTLRQIRDLAEAELAKKEEIAISDNEKKLASAMHFTSARFPEAFVPYLSDLRTAVENGDRATAEQFLQFLDNEVEKLRQVTGKWYNVTTIDNTDTPIDLIT